MMTIQKQIQSGAGVSGHQICRVMAFLCWAVLLILLTGCENYRIDNLIRDLEAKEPEIRMNAAIDLGKLKNPRVVPPLIAALKDKDQHVPLRAEESLIVLGPVAVDALTGALRNRQEVSRPVIARILGKIMDLRGIDPLVEAMADPNPALAKEARDALLKVLPAALKDSNVEVRLNAARLLQDVPDPSAVEPLIGALRDKDGNVRQRAGIALAKIGQPAESSLVGLLRDPNPEMRRLGAEQLGKIRDPETLEPLLAALRDPDPNVQWWAAWALGEIGPPVEKVLNKLMRDPDLAVQRSAKEALNKIQNIPLDKPPR
jgi:HEAT repeat protein